MAYRLMKFTNPTDFDDDDAVEVDALYFDGYIIGERLLEGLTIKVELNPEKTHFKVSADWPKKVNSLYWTDEALYLLYSGAWDVFSTDPDQHNDDGFIESDEPWP